MTDPADLDAEIVALRVGLSERQVARRLGCTVREVRAALDRHAARKHEPAAVLSSLVDGVERLRAIELTAPNKRVRARAKRERELQAKVVLRRVRI